MALIWQIKKWQTNDSGPVHYVCTDKLCHTRSVAYSVELAVLNKHQISEGGAYLDSYLDYFCFKF